MSEQLHRSAISPWGRRNDFSKNLNLPLGDLTALAATAVTGVPHTHDLGRFNGQSFLYVAAFGAFTEIAYSTPQKAKNLLGYNAYVPEVVKNLGSIKPYHLKVEYDDNVIEGDFLYGMVSNTTSAGRSTSNFPGHRGPLRRPAGGDPHLRRPGRERHGGIQPRPADDPTPPSLNSMMTTFSTPPRSSSPPPRRELRWTPGRRGRRGPLRRLEVEAVHTNGSYHHPRPRKTQ
ncbi:MAG: diacylglycerol/lipid kinase family protein [Evtepia sp.]